MNNPENWLIGELRDPATQDALQLSADGATFRNSSGTVVARMVAGIPRFVLDEHLESFGLQWTTFDVAHDEEDRQTFSAKTGVALELLRGQRILDAGCGGGRYAKVCAEAGAMVTAADHSRAVEKARDLCRELNSVQCVQADLKHLPLQRGHYDFVFSIGVMHHDVNTRQVFEAVAAMVRPGGRYSVWLYRRNQWWQEFINSSLRAITTRLPANCLLPFCHVGAILGGIPIINRTLNKIISFSAHPCYQNRVCDTHDWWAPRYQHHHTAAELKGWFREAGFERIEELPPEKSGPFYQRLWEWNLLPGSGVNVTGIRQWDSVTAARGGFSEKST